MRPLPSCLRAALIFCGWLALSTGARAQTAFAYNRVGTYQSGIQCFTFDDVANRTWTLSGPLAGSVPQNTPVRIIGRATLGLNPNCVASTGDILVAEIRALDEPPGLDFCNGDGGDQMGCTNCPCSNNAPVGSIGGCHNSAGRSAKLISDGSDSVTAATLCFRLQRGVPGSFAMLLSGSARAPDNPLNPCFALNPGSGTRALAFDGLRCAVGAVLRHGGRAVDINGDVGALTTSWGYCAAGFPNHAQFLSGHTRYFQVIYRDANDAVCGRGLNTSQGVAISFAP